MFSKNINVDFKDLPSRLKQGVGMFLRELWALLHINLDKVLIFILIYTVLGSLAGSTIVSSCIKGLSIASGQSYIGPDNLFAVLLNPFSLLVLFVHLFLLVFLSVFEMAGLIHAYGMAKVGKRTTLRGMLSAGLRGCVKILHIKNWTILPFILLLFPLTGLLSLSGVSMGVEIPEFVRDFIVANDVYKWLYRLVYLVLILIEFLDLYAINYFLMRDKATFNQSCKESSTLIRGNYVRTIGCMILVGVLFMLATSCVAGVVSDIATRAVEALNDGVGTLTGTYYTVTAVTMTKQVVTGIFMPAINLAALTVMFYQLTEEKNMLVSLSRNNFNDTPSPKIPLVILCAGVIAVVGYNLYNSRNVLAHFNDEETRPTVVAHRGDSVNAPENTMPAFELALEEGVEWVELDVHQTKDGVVVVSHDEDLTRVSGQDINVSDLTYEETRSLDVGSWFSPEFSYVRLSTLDEVLKLFKDSDVKIQIEIKADGPTENLVARTIKVIEDNDMVDRVMFTSLQKYILDEIKEQTQEIPTVYSMYVAYSDITEIDNVDHFTIEESNYTRELVENIHAEGMLCFAWTANTEETVQYLVDCGVDGILTDDPQMLNKALDNADYSGGLLREFRLILDKLLYGY